MHDSLFVPSRNGFAGMQKKPELSANTEFVRRAVSQEVFCVGEELHYEIRQPLKTEAELAGGVDLRDVWMHEPAEHLDLSVKPLGECRPAGVPHELDGNGPRRPSLPAPIHAAHTALGNQRLDDHISDRFADQRVAFSCGECVAFISVAGVGREAKVCGRRGEL